MGNIHTMQGADPGFFPGGVIWHNVAEKYFGSLGGSYGGGIGGLPKKIRNMKCSRSDSEHT